VLPHPVSARFFELARHEGARPSILVDGVGADSVDAITRLSILLNGREERVPIAWLGPAHARARAQLDAASVQVLDIAEEAERARLLSHAWAYIHLAPGGRLPHGVAQAMAAAVPCLVSDTPPHRALIRHGETGFVCTSERDLREKLILLLRDPAERRHIGEAARAEAERRFTSRHFERAILRAYGFSSIAAAPEHAALQASANAERSTWNGSLN
jgi:glycosyltransferase involved in cell wall biosynthesis